MTQNSRDRNAFPRRSSGTSAALVLLTVLLAGVSLCLVGPRRSAAQATKASEPGNARTPPRTIVEPTFQPLVDDGTHVGIVVGVVDRGRRRVFASRLCDPLGLKSTRFHLSAELHSRLVPGHDASGHPVPNWEFTPALAGAGALRSSAHDMLQYVAANLDLSAPRLKAAMSNTQAARHRVDAGQAILYVALGWHVLNVNGAEIIWHNGGTGGYSSIVCFNRKRHVGLVALSNSAEPGDKEPLTDAGLLALTKMISPTAPPSTRPGPDAPVPAPGPGVHGPAHDAPTSR